MKLYRPLLASLALLTVAAGSTVAQTQPRPQMSPQMQAKMKAWQKWGATHKNISSLQQTMAGLDAMDKDPKTRLTKDQARTVVAILKTWRNKPVMSDAQANKVNKDLTAKLSVAQLKKIATARPGMGGRGRRPGGPGGQMGSRPNGGQQGNRPGGGRRFDPASFPNPKEYNPLNPSTLPWPNARDRAKQQLDTLTKTLTARAK